MEVRLAYGKDGVALDVPEWVEMDRYGLAAADKAIAYPDFADSLAAAGGGTVLEEEPPLIIVNDGHRSTPTLRVLEWLDRYDSTLLDNARFLIACGTHGEPLEDHLRTIFGKYLKRVRDRLSWHDCHDLSRMVKIGSDHFGQNVFVNRQVVEAMEAENVLVITSVEPHYFAGFSGGRKSFFPGCTDMATIERNHNLVNSLDCAPLRLTGNPMAEHIDEMLGLLKPEKIFSIQLVVDAGHRIGHVFCGRIDEVFLRATEAAIRLYAYEVSEPYDLAIAEVRPPLDRSLYQIQKALENCQAAVTDGGTAVVVAACEDGIGKRSFYDLAKEWDVEKNQSLDGVPRFGSHKLSRVNAMTRRINVRLYSDLPDNQPRQVFYEPVDDLQALMDECLNRDNRKRLAIVHDAGHTVLQPISAR